MSPALCLVHEMGHAAQQLDGEEIRSTKNSAYLTGEENNLNKYEKPIARELGEPIRKKYTDAKGRIAMSNSTHYITKEKTPLWLRLLFGIGLIPSNYPVNHNTK